MLAISPWSLVAPSPASAQADAGARPPPRPGKPLEPGRQALAGVWYEQFDPTKVAVLRLAEDGTHTMTIDGKVQESESGTWRVEGGTLVSVTKNGTDGRPPGTEDRVRVARVEEGVLVLSANGEGGKEVSYTFTLAK